MKKLFAMLLVLVVCAAQAQTNDNDTDTVPPYKKTDKIPEFAILQPDSIWFTNKQLPANKPLVIVYFNPTCGHCQLAAEAFVKEIDKLKNVEIVWVSYNALPEIQEFAEAYKFNQYSNIIFGRDPNYKIPVFYDVKVTPFMAVYDKRGKFLHAYPEGASPVTISKLIKTGK